MTVVPHAGSRRTVLQRSLPAQRASRTGVMSSSAFAIGALAVLSIGLLSLLVLNTALAKGSFRAHELRVQKADLAQREQLLRTQIQDASSPVTLTKRARAMGLVPATAPVFIRLADAQILGESLPAGVPLDPSTGQPLTSTAPTAPVVGGTDPAAAGEPTAPASPEPVQSAPAPGVATTPGTDTEQPLGITGQ
ncbi:MAG: hypothetical protein IPG68_10385 [Micrococcales bacterium]|nr:hypothetical protein [Micrococcales bacterium]